MPTNHYFQAGRGIGSRSEEDLLQQLTNECIKIVGADFTYIPRDIVKLDELFHEDTLSKFTKNYTIEMYIENYDAFNGIGPQITNFGFQLDYQLRLICSRERFRLVTGKVVPVEGDLIFFATTNTLFEIKFIEDKKPLFPLGSRQYFILSCATFKYSNETMATGTTADTIQSQYQNTGTTITDPFAKNTEIDTDAAPAINTIESNPFGGA